MASFSTPYSPLSSSASSSSCPDAARTPANRTSQVEEMYCVPRGWTSGRHVPPGPLLSHHSFLVWLIERQSSRTAGGEHAGEDNAEGWGFPHNVCTERCAGAWLLRWQRAGLSFTKPRLGLPGLHIPCVYLNPNFRSFGPSLNTRGDGGQPRIHGTLSQKNKHLFLTLSKLFVDVDFYHTSL